MTLSNVIIALTTLGFTSTKANLTSISKEKVMISTQKELDNSNKSILARGCDPYLSQSAAQFLPPMMGNPEYVASSNDNDFIEKLKSRKWSVIYFAPGACRYNAAKMPIPGGNENTQGWSLEEYHQMVRKYQGDDIIIVETPSEDESVQKLIEGLAKARSTK